MLATVEFINRERPFAVSISAGIERRERGYHVFSRHRRSNGLKECIDQCFGIDWTDPVAPLTEYHSGLSVVHDTKDHYLYGLGITPLTEFQTIVQTYLGREMARTNPSFESARIEVCDAIDDELYGPRSRVYGPLSTGLLDLACPNLSSIERLYARSQMRFICLSIIWPILYELYSRNPVASELQLPLVEQPELVSSLVPNLKWECTSTYTLLLSKNSGYRVCRSAYIDEELRVGSIAIKDAIDDIISRRGLGEFGSVFSTADYVIGV